MSDGLHIQQLTLGQLAGDDPWADVNDPESIAPMSPHKRDVFLRNPATNEPDTIVQLLAVADKSVVGRVDLLPGALIVGGRRVITAWGSGMFVPESQRGKGIGKALAQHREQVHAVSCSCGVSRMLQPIYSRLGWTDMPMRRFILLRTARPVAERLLGRSWLSRLAAGGGNIALAVHGGSLAAVRSVCARGVRVQPLDAMPHEMDELLAHHSAPVACERTADWINWLLSGCFNPHPRNGQNLLLFTDHRDQPLGYVITKTRYHETASHRGFRDILLGSLQDWMIFQPNALSFRSLVLLTVRALAEQGAHAIEVCLPPALGSGGLRRLGFMPVGQQHALFKAAPESALAGEAFTDPAAWFIRPGDGDNFFT